MYQATWALISVLIRDGFGACFVVPEVVQTILHFGNTLTVHLLAKTSCFFCKKNSRSYPHTFFLTSSHSLFHVFLTAESICL